jgi:dienelactone hydrolase
MVRLSSELNVDIFMIEYNGYGPFKDVHSSALDQDLETIKVYEACYDYLISDICLRPEDLVLTGFSLGTGPATFAASHPDFLASGLIIEGGFASGLSVESPNVSCYLSGFCL